MKKIYGIMLLAISLLLMAMVKNNTITADNAATNKVDAVYKQAYPVTLYKDCNYKGGSKSLSLGFHRLSDLGIGGNELSSFYLSEGYSLTLYDEDNYRGRSKTWNSGSVSCLLGDYWNDRAMSVYVAYHSRHHNDNSGSYPVTLYKDCNYKGGSKSLSLGFHRLSDLGIGGKELSSFRIQDGYKLTLYEEDNYRGKSDSWSGSVSCLSGNFWNDRAMSVYISKGSSSSTKYNNSSSYPVTLYKDCNYKGDSKSLSVGFHKLGDLGIGGRNLSSFRIQPGYKLTLYEEDNYRGKSDSWSGSVSCLAGNFWNDKAMSVYISKSK